MQICGKNTVRRMFGVRLLLLPAILAAAGAVMAPARPALATASAWADNPQTHVRLVSASTGVGPGRTLVLGLQFRMEPGWKVYWRSPGDAGYPPTIDWTGSENLAGAVMRWPAPSRFSVLGFDTLGYKDEVVLPLEVTITEPERPVALRATVDYLTCDEICVPQQVALALDLPAGVSQNSAYAHLIDRFAARVPSEATGLGLAVDRVEARGNGTISALRVTARSDTPFTAPDVFLEGPDLVNFGEPQITRLAAGRMALLEVPVRAPPDKLPALVGAHLTVTLVDGGRALEVTAVVEPARTAAPMSYLAVIGLALLGGLILNLMPCVLPVLSLKLLNAVSHGGAEARTVRRRFLASAAGIVSTFVVLAAVLAGFKAAGAAIGWGIQFQSPIFLTAMTIVVTLFAANLWGLFEVRLPGAVGDALVRAGGDAAPRGLAGDFLTGALATLLATPCSAPFLGTAVGFALSGRIADIFVIFVTLGLGLSLPYLTVAAAPRLATRMPRPGPWMVWLKGLLGLALAGTGIWLLSVLATIASALAAYVVGALMAVAVLALAVRPMLAVRMRPLAPVLVAVLAAAAFVAPARLPADASTTVEAKSGDHWRPFDWAAIPALVAEGKTVFVDVTADWCITCQANKRLVLYQDAVSQRLAGAEVVAMVADWTKPSEEIATYLASFGRYGIPFNVAYGPGAPEGVTLPELLTVDAVMGALDKAAGGAGAGRAVARD